jgi:hypothetical protein
MLLSLVLLSTVSAWTQNKDAGSYLRTVQGSVIDSNKNPVPSAVVYLLNIQTKAVRTYIVDQAAIASAAWIPTTTTKWMPNTMT